MKDKYDMELFTIDQKFTVQMKIFNKNVVDDKITLSDVVNTLEREVVQ